MDGRNSAGRRISLLNDDSRMPSLEPSNYRSRTSSYASSPCPSPQTPQLLRSDSTDSAAMINTPSPLTPSYPYDEAAHSPRPLPGTLPYFSLSQHHMLAYPQPKAAVVPFVPPPQPYANPDHVFVRPPGIERQPMPPANPKTKKNQYPCPLATLYSCSDYFTTSGHAARHAKKHTGKKDAICPECFKAFTRKDNMEQHRRTHSNGRNARSAAHKDAVDARKKLKPTGPRPRPSPIQSSQPKPTSSSLVDPALPVSPASSSYAVAPAVRPADDYHVASPYADSAPIYPPPEPFQLHPHAASDDAFRLHTLAYAASGEKRKYDAYDA